MPLVPIVLALQAAPTLLAMVRPADCADAATTADGERYGNRAVVAAEGDRVLIQCGDGTVKLWRDGTRGLADRGRSPLFRSAQVEGLVPPSLPCPSSAPPASQAAARADCDLVDIDTGGTAAIVANTGGGMSFVIAGERTVALTVWQQPGVLLPRTGATGAMVADRRHHPAELSLVPLAGGAARRVAVLPQRNLLFEDGEGEVETMRYAPAADLVLLGYFGVFRVARDMALVRAVTRDDRERWVRRVALPSRDESLIVGDGALLQVFAGGRYAVLSRTSDRRTSDIVDAATGATVAQVAGWPIATARDATRVLMRRDDGLAYLDLGPMLPRR